MGFERRFTAVLLLWLAGLLAALVALAVALATPGLAAARLVAALITAALAAGLWQHVRRTNRMLARFVEAVRHGDFTTRFAGRGDAGFGALGDAMSKAMRDLRAERSRAADEHRFLEALLDDMPVALLTVDQATGVRLVNKAARRLFGAPPGVRPQDFAAVGATFAARLAEEGEAGRELMILRLGGSPQRAIVRSAQLERLGLSVRAVTVEPVQGTLDAIEMAAQTDLVRVLTHEILNSLTPVTSLGGTAAQLLDPAAPDIDGARIAVTTLVRRAASLRQFIDSYRAVARPPEVRARPFAAEPFVAELARLFAVEWPALLFESDVSPGLTIEADPDLLAHALINLLRNAAQAVTGAAGTTVRLSMLAAANRPPQILIADDGPGIPASLRRDIFLPFFTTRAEGSGVGLNLVRQIVVAHGWTIDVSDDRSGGALFRIICR